MKKITIPFLLLLMSVLAINITTNAQVRRSSFRVDAPSSIAGYKNITEADMQGTSPWGTSIDSAWEQMPVGFDATNPNGCLAFTPGTFTGKFALVFRGDCEFGAKALAAQNAGARGVIIVNNLLGVAGMGAGAQGASVTIPVVMVTTAEGNAMKNQILAGTPVFISLTNWRFDPTDNPIDIGFMNDGPIHFMGKCMPIHQTNTTTTDDRYRMFAGAQFYNFSVNSFDTIFQKGVMSYNSSFTGGSYAPTDSDEVTWNFTTGPTSIDSTLFLQIDTVGGVQTGFDMNNRPKGRYTMMNYMNVVPNTETSTAMLNNTINDVFAISDSIYSKSGYDFANNRPYTNDYVNFAAGANEWGPVLDIRNGGYSAKKAQVVVMRDVIDDSLFDGQAVEMVLSKWDDNDDNGAIDVASELTEVANGSYTLGPNDIVPIQGLVVTMNLDNVSAPGQLVKLEADSKYWLRVRVPGGTGNFAIGTDYDADYTANIQAGIGQGNPLFTTQIFMGGFANGGSPSIALHMNTNLAESVKDINAFAGNVKVYPNPASDVVNVALSLDQISATVNYEIVDMTGKSISVASRKNVKTDNFSFNTSKLAAGTYFINIVTESGKTQSKFVVAK